MGLAPEKVSKTRLWKRVALASELSVALEDLREIVEVVANKAAETIPEFTDHSITHMDALWSVADQVLTQAETEQMTSGEAFVLGASFYIHDLGMAFGATAQGRQSLKESKNYERAYLQLSKHPQLSNDAHVLALRIAARELHALKAETFIDEVLPGLDRHLLEKKALREHWGHMIGKVSASHHWSLQELDAKLGAAGKTPDATGNPIDLGFVAGVLRVVDYAHINWQRATSLDRLLRARIPSESLMHWGAQEHITGPTRDGTQLVFGCTRPIKEIDAWWTFYEMAAGLDREISAVHDYLAERASSKGRFSLEGVKGARTPQAFSAFVLPGGFEPVDIKFKPDSVDRLVELLGGRQLYGEDHFAAIRELLQNARDAIMLRQASEAAGGRKPQPGQIEVAFNNASPEHQLVVGDDGVGMNDHVVSNYLLGLAADYWHSSDFYAEHPGVVKQGFAPVGRFGIGFLSVFMLGDSVEVETERRGAPRLRLRLQGLGKRGSLVSGPQSGYPGTAVRITIRPDMLPDFENLGAVVRAKAPMLSVPVAIEHNGARTVIEPAWWRTIPQKDLIDFVVHRDQVATTPPRLIDTDESHYRNRWLRAQQYLIHRHSDEPMQNWTGDHPEVNTESVRVLAVPGSSGVVLCAKGFGVSTVPISGMMGVVDIGDLELNAARSKALLWDPKAFRLNMLRQVRPHIVKKLDALSTERNVPLMFSFLVQVCRDYGVETLLESGLPWMTVISPPGSGLLVSASTLRDQFAASKEVAIGYGDGCDPWTVERRARALFSDMKSPVVVPVPSVGNQSTIGSYRDEEVITAPLEEHFHESSREGAPLFAAVLRTLASAWGVDVKALKNAKWRREQRTVFGHLTRKE